jgi:hypothetical protein
MGLKRSPVVVAKLTRWIRRHQCNCLFFVDDVLLFGAADKVRHLTPLFISLMDQLGLILHPTKGWLDPRSRFVFLGLVVDFELQQPILPLSPRSLHDVIKTRHRWSSPVFLNTQALLDRRNLQTLSAPHWYQGQYNVLADDLSRAQDPTEFGTPPALRLQAERHLHPHCQVDRFVSELQSLPFETR